MGIQAAFDSNGDPVCGNEEMADTLSEYWAAKAEEKDYVTTARNPGTSHEIVPNRVKEEGAKASTS